jgi:glycosyltransferase involved in cell wall biosynthesis
MNLAGKRIGIDVRALTPPVTGVGVVLHSLLRELAILLPDTEWFCYSTRPVVGLPDSPRFHLRLGRGFSARWGSIHLQTGVVRQARRDRVDLFWGPLQVLPLPLAEEMPTVVTLHDLVFERYPETLSWRNRVLLRRLARPSLQRATRVVAVSEATASAAVADLGLPRERLRVVRNAVDSKAELPSVEESRRFVHETCGVLGDYLLFVGTLEPRKNLEGLLAAVETLIERERFDGRVVLVGGRGWRATGLEAQLSHPALAARIHRPGYLERSHLVHLYRAARLFVMPSLYEGFGLPVLEAMACGTPVVCSDREPFPEVAGDAAVLASLEAEDGLADAIDRVWNDQSLRQRLSEAGRRRAAGFEWSASARAMADVLSEALAEER